MQNPMNPDLHTLLYCSRNRIRGSRTDVAKELDHILAVSRANNARLGITGALLYTAGMFAQVLEGSLDAIERTFETIQCDSRHSEVIVIQHGSCSKRQFPEWSMAFTGTMAPADLPLAAAAFDSVFSKAEGAGDQMLLALKDLVTREEDWVLLDMAS